MRIGVVGAAALGGLIAAALDVGAAMAINQVGAEVVLKAVARGLLGRSAMQGGAGVAALGLALQLGMGALIGAIYGVGCRRWPGLAQRWFSAGLGYGIAIFLVMNWVVVPLSAVRRFPRFTPLTAAETFAAMLGFGLIVAFAASRADRRSA